MQPNTARSHDAPPKHARRYGVAGLRAFLQPEELPGTPPGFWQAREPLLSTLTRAGALFGSLGLLVAVTPLLGGGPGRALALPAAVLGLIWVLALARRLTYHTRAGLLLAGVYLLGLNQLLHFGFSENTQIFLAAFALLAPLLFTPQVGAGALLLSIASLAVAGQLSAGGSFTPAPSALRPLSTNALATSCLLFLLVVVPLQLGVATLLRHLQTAWQGERDARALLAQRAAEHANELATAHTNALQARRYEAEQKEFLAVLHQSALELFNRHDLDGLLEAIVDRAAQILEAPFGELLILDGEEMAVRAFTSNQPFLAGDRAKRGEALLSWEAYDTRQPVIVDDYSAWQAQRSIYQEIDLCATADFPILAGEKCLGVLAMGRNNPGPAFSPDDVQKGRSFANLIAIVLDNATLYSTALREIAERKQAEQVLQHYANELQTHNAELDAFAHTVAHDLKNPLTSMLGYTELLQMSFTDMPAEQVMEFLNDIVRIGEKMTLIINGLLLLANTRAHGAIRMQQIDMRTIIKEMNIRFSQTIAHSGATLTLPESWPLANGYAPWVEEVWANYLSNAIKYGGSPPAITLGADHACGEGFVRFWMRDNGQGLSADEQAQLFTPFIQLHSHRREGHGLGLAIVQQIVTKLGGSVGVESAPGQGSTFYFTLPTT